MDEDNIFPRNFSEYLANFFKEVRQEAGLTQEQMAKILGTSQRVYQRWETGNTEPTGEFTAKMFLYKDYLSKTKKRLLEFVTPHGIAKQVVDRLGTRQDIDAELRETVKPVILLIKELLWYAHLSGHSGRNSLNRPPYYIEWHPSGSGLLKVILNLQKEIGKSITVLDAHNVNSHLQFHDVQIHTYIPGKWIFGLEHALNFYKGHTYQGINDDPFVPLFLQAFNSSEDE